MNRCTNAWTIDNASSYAPMNKREACIVATRDVYPTGNLVNAKQIKLGSMQNVITGFVNYASPGPNETPANNASSAVYTFLITDSA